MKMLLLRVLVTLAACWIVKCDLLDLYVQHMDETMRTNSLYRDKRHPADPVTRRMKRSLDESEPLLRIGNLKKQRLDVDENWLKQWKAKRKMVSYKNDAVDYPNRREENLNPDQHEILSNTNPKHLEKTSTVLENATDSQSSISQDPIIEEREETSEDGRSIVENETNEEVVIETLTSEEGFSEGNEKDPEEMETEDNSQFEIISENERINPKPFIDPILKRTPKGSRVPKKYFPEKPAKSHVKDDTATRRSKRSASPGVNELEAEGPNITDRPWNFTRYEPLGKNSPVILEWDPSGKEEVAFRVTAKTLGYVGVGFNDKINMKGADILLAWVDDHTGTVNLLDSYGIESNAAPVTDASQDVQVLGGSQNETHTVVTFVRKWQTCDSQDYQLMGDSIRVLWAMHEHDPELNTAMWHGNRRGGRTLRLRTAVAHSPPRDAGEESLTWDVKLNQYEVPDMNTVYVCKIFQFPTNLTKHHMIGYTPIKSDLVHHMILYECTSPMVGKYLRMVPTDCYTNKVPSEWNSCLQPVLVWARGGEGEWFPEHVGIPIGERGEYSYYMLEVHYNNPTLSKMNDSSGIRLYLTEKFRPHEAGILVAGVAVSPLHMIPPQQKEYATVGYCTKNCTEQTFPKNGINIVSVVLHSHLAGRRLTLKHIRQGEELPRIVQDNHFDFNYQQSYTLKKEVKLLPGDELVTECVYRTLDRSKPTVGGYMASQEMCLAFVMHYPKTSLAACYSITPVEKFFTALHVDSLKGMTMDQIKKLFLNGSEVISPSTNRENNHSQSRTRSHDKNVGKKMKLGLRVMREHLQEKDNIYARLIIEKPEEFRNRTIAEHMMALPWTEDLLTRAIENYLYYGDHLTFCRKADDELAIPTAIQSFPNFTALPETNVTVCSDIQFTSGSTEDVHIYLMNYLVTIVVVSIVML
ncbi:PREDICTED: MOXD1 homolog 1 [Vollenhovia emeryi]|uniref:MOXD1 homolog 1 n=1 Tax=Vollenhovia emeryi TaxID=411798 RepID=UPI0005F57D19|nr:PREDICTED: MOXD1 homolog 1 [Vollenhovia emeryi]